MGEFFKFLWPSQKTSTLPGRFLFYLLQRNKVFFLFFCMNLRSRKTILIFLQVWGQLLGPQPEVQLVPQPLMQVALGKDIAKKLFWLQNTG